jgi:RHS repeat-associated protein
MTKIEDQLENSVTYEYDETTGLVKKVIDAEENEIAYEYDNLGNVININSKNGDYTYSNTYTYTNDLLTNIEHNQTNYQISYDEYGNQQNVKVENNNLITNTYEANNGNLIKSTYGNSQTVNYSYDRFDRIASKEYSNGKYTFSYDGRSNLKNIVDEINNNTTTYTYDMAERLTKEENTNGYQVEYEYDKNSNISKISDKLNNDTKTTIYNYDLNNYLNSIDLYNGANIINHYDKLQRISQKEIKTNNGSYYINYEYIDIKDSNKTTTQIKSISNSKGEKINYTYDKNGNIKTISNDSGILQEYYYDSLNQLIREDNKEQNKTITYSYDEGGNLTNKKEYQYTTEDIKTDPTKTINYTYNNENWNDQLTKYDGKVITYDEIGNLLTYDENTYTWQNGRELARINNSKTGNTITYKYNSDGIRTYKNVNGVETYYYLRGDKVIYEKTNDNIIYYMYDDNDELIGLVYNNSTYYYKKNLQGDIIGILDENLNDVVQYSYDSWGKVLNVLDANGNEITDPNHIGNINPYRYRSYRYDNESGLYYLQSRYYNPEFERFINADAVLCVGSVGGENNLYLYCSNNPINNADHSGYFLENVLKAINNAINYIMKTIINNSSYRKPVTSSSSKSNTVLSKNNRKPGKTPPKSWPKLPKNLRSKKTKWNSKGYWDGKYGETTWDSKSHGAGVDRGNGRLDGHWDTDSGRFNRDGLELVVGGVAVGAAGYVTYRVIRLVPSLLFPPSIVPNLIVP